MGKCPQCLTAGLNLALSDSMALVVYTTLRSSTGTARNGTNSSHDRSQLVIIAGWRRRRVPREFANGVTRKDVGVRGQLGAGGEGVFEGSAAVATEQVDCGGVEGDGPAGLGLGVLLDGAAGDFAQRSCPADRGGVEVDIRPAEAAELAATGAGEGAEAEEAARGAEAAVIMRTTSAGLAG